MARKISSAVSGEESIPTKKASCSQVKDSRKGVSYEQAQGNMDFSDRSSGLQRGRSRNVDPNAKGDIGYVSSP